MNQRDSRTPISPTDDNLRPRGLQTVPLVVACLPRACEGEGLLKTLGQGKDLRFWVAEVSDCKLGLGAVPGLSSGPAQLALRAPTKQGLGAVL